jgi:hypothetical protein
VVKVQRHGVYALIKAELNEVNREEHKAKTVFWQGDSLKEDFLKARAMTFGYDSKITHGYHATVILFQDHHFPFPFLPFVDV